MIAELKNFIAKIGSIVSKELPFYPSNYVAVFESLFSSRLLVKYWLWFLWKEAGEDIKVSDGKSYNLASDFVENLVQEATQTLKTTSSKAPEETPQGMVRWKQHQLSAVF